MGRNKGSQGLGEGKRKERGRVKGGERTQIGEKGGDAERKARVWKRGLERGIGELGYERK